MSTEGAEPKAEMPELDLWGSGRNPRRHGIESASRVTVEAETRNAAGTATMEAVVSRENMLLALHAVERNRGAAGVDGMTTGQLRDHLRQRWEQIKAHLLEGSYQPQPVRRVDIPKPGGGTRMLGIPTVMDRLIQQALHQVMSPVWEPDFSEHSYGFRPGRGAHGAVEAARAHVEAGHRWVVDLDLEKFFDRVNHDVLMARVERKVRDRRMLGLTRRYLQSGMMVGGLVEQRIEGTPQGGPLSPLLSNILLDDLDKELERRGHRFCRYADDCNVYVKSARAGERVMASLKAFLGGKLRLKVNEAKSSVTRPWETKFLGYSMTVHRQPRLKVAARSVERFKDKVRQLVHVGRGRNLQRFIDKDLNPVVRGWANYYGKATTYGIFEDLDGWLRRKLRCLIWRQWKRPYSRARRLIALGFTEAKAWCCAGNGRGPWWNAGAPHMNAAYPAAEFQRMGLVSLLATVKAHA
jgi:group II intron reverse transcriptase/maturase